MKQIIIVVLSLFVSFNVCAQSSLTLKDLQLLQQKPTQTQIIKSKGYKYLKTNNHGEKIYVGMSKDTISIYYQNITWSAGIGGKVIFDKLKKQAISSLTYDKEYSNAEIGDEPETPVYTTNYSYFSKNGIEHTATIFYTDKTKKIVKEYVFYVGESE